nr:hypothetical protein A4A49_31267 [Ipomoea batatas]
MDYGKRSRGRGGFLKGKLMRSLYRATATQKLPPSSTTVLHLPYAAKVKQPNPTGDHGGYVNHHIPAHQSHKNIMVNQDQVIPQLPTHATSLSYYPPTTAGGGGASYSATKMDAVYGGIAVDEEIDRKAANYISSVRERFRLHYLN